MNPTVSYQPDNTKPCGPCFSLLCQLVKPASPTPNKPKIPNVPSASFDFNRHSHRPEKNLAPRAANGRYIQDTGAALWVRDPLPLLEASPWPHHRRHQSAGTHVRRRKGNLLAPQPMFLSCFNFTYFRDITTPLASPVLPFEWRSKDG